MMPEEDVYTQSRRQMLAEMAVSMGGRTAEELVLGDITTGASADIDHLTRIARAMVCIYGMTDLGPVKYLDMNPHPHVRIDMPPPDSLSPETTREIDLAIRKLVNDAHDTARDILTRDRVLLEKFAQALLERETMDIAEIEALLGIRSACRQEPEPAVEAPAPETTGTEDHAVSGNSDPA